MIDKGNRRRSDPGYQVILTSLALKRPQSPPIPPKRTQSPPSHLNASIEEEDSIYEATLLMVEPKPRKICQELDIPLIMVRKPVRRSKLSSSNSEDNTSIQSDSDPSQTQTTEDAPPAIPPRVPLAQDKSKTPGHNLTPVHRGGIALPQPTAEEWHSLRPSSPNPSSSPIVPHRVVPPTPTSPLLPHRVPPPQPTKTGRDDRRLSNISGHSINQAIKEQEEDGNTKGEEEDTEEDRAPAAPPRRGSYIDWESRLQDGKVTRRGSYIDWESRLQDGKVTRRGSYIDWESRLQDGKVTRRGSYIDWESRLQDGKVTRRGSYIDWESRLQDGKVTRRGSYIDWESRLQDGKVTRRGFYIDWESRLQDGKVTKRGFYIDCESRLQDGKVTRRGSYIDCESRLQDGKVTRRGSYIDCESRLQDGKVTRRGSYIDWESRLQDGKVTRRGFYIDWESRLQDGKVTRRGSYIDWESRLQDGKVTKRGFYIDWESRLQDGKVTKRGSYIDWESRLQDGKVTKRGSYIDWESRLQDGKVIRRGSYIDWESRLQDGKVTKRGFYIDCESRLQDGKVTRRGSYIDWESRLQDEPLYQTYRATVITKEIRRQTVCRNISKTSADYHMDWTARRSGVGIGSGGVGVVGSGTIPLPTPGQSTLWQDLPGVRDSGVLETLSPEQCKYQESMFEVLTSEASYLRSLRVLTEHFLDSRDLDEALNIRDRKTLFSNVLRVREVSERFLKDLEDRMDEGLMFSDICDIIHYHAQHNFPAYIDYVRNQIYQEKTYTSLMKTNVAFATVITRLQESPQCQRLPFMSFLLLPFQRITRIKMLIENILKRTKEGTTEEQTASKALDSVSKIIEECNTQVGKMKQVEELIHLSKTLEFDKLKAIPIISQTRFLEKRGEVQEMAKGGTLFNLRPKFTPVYLFLFNDLLIIATKKGSERFVVMDHAHRSLVQVQPIRADQALSPSYEHCFCLTLLENHQGRMMERLMKAPSQSDLHRWIAAFPNPSNPDGDEEEVIYEDWDCPQVQCVEQYVAQQADELTLEPTEIINVVRKTNEGLYEGIRLSDGQKGWFPVENVLEITNEHVRRRNLRERYRVIQAASIVTNKVKTLS
ncbi:uncharacterized protein LOC123484480 [Coregonus clupeaformis]|uniref:uncharacterized protein LOC123484480 n=1 Tax=Coregonus clupeaformis TaxID=59861 RepID=UPI001E1C53C8|nr:uncharacterized protein LOC123484480 [Coregonus clupeaformis]